MAEGHLLELVCGLILGLEVAILAGGVGSRLSEETVVKPKPMVEIGGQPILWHVMMHYAHYGFDEFAIALAPVFAWLWIKLGDYVRLNKDLITQVIDSPKSFRVLFDYPLKRRIQGGSQPCFFRCFRLRSRRLLRSTSNKCSDRALCNLTLWFR